MRTLGKFETRREICLNDTKTVKMSTAAIILKVGDVAELWKIFSSAHTGVELVKMAAIIGAGDVAEPHDFFSVHCDVERLLMSIQTWVICPLPHLTKTYHSFFIKLNPCWCKPGQYSPFDLNPGDCSPIFYYFIIIYVSLCQNRLPFWAWGFPLVVSRK